MKALHPGDVVRGRVSKEYAAVFERCGEIRIQYADGVCQKCWNRDDYDVIIPATEQGRAEGRGEGPTAVAGPLPPHRYDWLYSTMRSGARKTAYREWCENPVFTEDE